MDANGVQSKKVARALRKLGIKIKLMIIQKPYRIKGGFQSWVADGLRVKEMKMETPLTILKEDTEAIIEETRPTLGAVFAVCVEMKESNGIPDLRRRERFKFAAVEFPKVEGSVRKLLKNANEIDDILTAAVIKNLKIVNI